MAALRPIRWLHLSDLHLGCRGEELWWQVEQDFRASVRELGQRLGPPDLVLITGDVAHQGRAAEFKLMDRFLADLRGWLGGDPLILAVPGNHDLERPPGAAAVQYSFLGQYHRGADDPDVQLVQDELWRKRSSALIQPLFKSYQTWFKRTILKPLKARGVPIHTSHFPGDFSAEIRLDGTAPLLIVGLNSTWQQYKAGDFEGQLLLPAEQFLAALPRKPGANPLRTFDHGHRALLLMHHPPAWLSPRGRRLFFESIYPGDRFDVCLYGHQHHGRAEEIRLAGGPPQCYFQAPSLFGLEHYGTSREERAMGYAWGQLDGDGTVRVWPLRRVLRGGGQGAFVHDSEFPQDRDGVVVCGHRQATRAAAVPALDLTPYLQDLIDRTDHINISGIASTVKGALRHPIELYTPLSTREELSAPGALAGGGRVGLAELLPRYPRLLIEGQPGAGKTTFLRFVACMLARDRVGEPCPGGGPWRRRHLGLDSATPPRLPVLLRVSELVALLLAKDAPRHRGDNRLWLLDLLERCCEENEHPVPRAHWQRLLESGETLLLLDGLDEAADEALRQRIFDIFRDACKHWQAPVVVTSRPLQTAPLREMGFHLATIEPLGDPEIRTFLDHWVTALHTSESAKPGAEAERYAKALAAAIVDRPRVRRLATNPVMLTCLCVVHWNEGRLPEGRSRVYRAVLRWLIEQRRELREQAGYSDLFAKWAFARLALTMMTTPRGKLAILDLDAAAKAVAPLLAREEPGLSPQQLRHRARGWLEFECLWSGILELLPGRRVRFWHLTFQEFLAALELAWRGDGDDPEADWWPLVAGHLADAQWRETVELLPGTLLDEGGRGRVDRLLERVLALRGPSPDLATEARVAGVLGRLLQPLEVLKYRTHPELRATCEAALVRSLAIFTPEGAGQVPLADRLPAAEALGQGGDPRFEDGRDNFLAVPPVPGLRLGKYPVTVGEYQDFVEAGRGYEEPRYWSAEGWEQKEKESWQAPGDWESQLEHPSRPVVEVSWYEAEAYCRWLTVQRGEEVRLPTGAEWQAAATPPRGDYPWGSAPPDPERANFGGNVRHPTPVGLYPAGDGPYGHSDLAGNVWEWCSDSVGEGDRELRGGGWRHSAADLRSAVRFWRPAWYRNGFIGFRVAVASASTA